MVHTEAVNISAAATEVVFTDLNPGNLGVNVEEIAVTIVIQGFELAYGGCVHENRYYAERKYSFGYGEILGQRT